MKEYNLLFFKMPKVASDYILSKFDEALNESADRKSIQRIVQGHGRFRSISSSDFSFCFVRNPYIRFISAWNWCIKNSTHPDERRFRKILQEKGIIPVEGVTDKNEKDIFLSFCRNLKGIIEYGPGEFTLWIPQYDWIYNGTGSQENKCMIDFIGRYENFESDLLQIYNKFGLKPNFSFGNNDKNDSIKSQLKYKDFYFNDEIIDSVYNFYKHDFEEFGYDKDINKTFTQLEVYLK